MSLRWNALIFFTVLLALGLFGWIWRRDVSSVNQLSNLIAVPEVMDATAVPTGQQMKALAAVIEKSPIRPRYFNRQDVHEAAQSVQANNSRARMWSVVTPVSPLAIHDFYESESHRQGWEIVADTPNCCLLLRRGTDELMIAFFPDRAGRGASIFYWLDSHP